MIPKNRCFSREFLFAYSWHFVLQIIQIMRSYWQILLISRIYDLEKLGVLAADFLFVYSWHFVLQIMRLYLGISLADFADFADERF